MGTKGAGQERNGRTTRHRYTDVGKGHGARLMMSEKQGRDRPPDRRAPQNFRSFDRSRSEKPPLLRARIG